MRRIDRVVGAVPGPAPSAGTHFSQAPSVEAQPGTGLTPVARRATLSKLALLLIALAALTLRVWGSSWQLPWQFHPDEAHYVLKAVDMVQEGNLNPKYFRNPSLYTYLLYVQFKLLNLVPLPTDLLGGVWEVLQPPALYLLLGRLTTALLGTATVVVVYRLGSELVGRGCGLLGALFLAVAFIHVRDSHFATNDVPATFFLALSVLFSAYLARSARSRDVLLAGLAGGLATSAKYNAGLFVVPLLFGYLTAHRRRSPTWQPLRGLIGAVLLALLAYLAGTPFTVLAWPKFWDDFQFQRRFARQGWEGQGPEPVSLLYLDALSQGLGWVMLGLAVLGLVLLARRRPAAAAVLGGFPLAYLALMLGVKLFFVRFAVPLVPFLCLGAAYSVLEVAGLGRGAARQTALASVLALGAISQPLWNDVQHDRILAQPDTRALAYTWAEANLPAGARIIVDDYTIRDRRPRAAMPDRARFDLDILNALSEHDLDYYRQAGYELAVASSFEYQRFPGRFNTYAELDRQAHQLAVFAPTGDGRELPFDIEDLYSPFHDLARYQRPGPTVKFYALR